MQPEDPETTTVADQSSPDTKAGGPTVCAECGGTGRVGAESCETCDGTGGVDEAVGHA
jgi:DnaJ-class molecular chaperone